VGNRFVCGEYLSPVVVNYGYTPDSIVFTGVVSKQVRADYTINSVSLSAIRSVVLDSASDTIQQGLNFRFHDGAIVLSGKTSQSGTRNLYLHLIRENSSAAKVKLKITIKNNEECIQSDF
jgi:hypothetical protein